MSTSMPVSAASLPALEIAGLISAIGARERSSFARAALHLAQSVLPVSHCTLFSHQVAADARDGAPRILSGASVEQEETFVFDVFHEYGAGLYAHDSNRPAWRRFEAAPRGVALLCRQQRGEIAHRPYRRFYERGEMVDRVSVLTRGADGMPLALNFYRDDRLGRYGAQELARLNGLAPILASAVQRHHASLAPASGVDAQPGWAARLTRLAPELSPRELAVLCGLLDGATLKTVAQALGIQPTTAATYRDRAYQRLGVRTLRDLPARLL